MELPLLPAPSAKTLEYWNFLLSRDRHFRQYGYPDWDKSPDCTVWKVLLGRQIVLGYYARNTKFDRSAIPVELSGDRDHLMVRRGQTADGRGDRMYDRLKCCAERQAAKAVKTPKVIYAPAPQPETIRLKNIELPDSDEINWLAKQWVRLAGKGSLKDARIVIESEFEYAATWEEPKLREDVQCVQEQIREHRKLKISAPDHPDAQWWHDEHLRLKRMEWVAQIKLDMLTKSAEERAGRNEELGWVQQVNDLARKADEKFKDLAQMTHPAIAAQSDEIKAALDDFVQVASSGTYQTVKALADTTLPTCENCGKAPVLKLSPDNNSQKLCRQCFEQIAVEQSLFDATLFERAEAAV